MNTVAIERPCIPARVVPRLRRGRNWDSIYRSRTLRVRSLLAPCDQGAVTLSVLAVFPVRSTKLKRSLAQVEVIAWASTTCGGLYERETPARTFPCAGAAGGAGNHVRRRSRPGQATKIWPRRGRHRPLRGPVDLLSSAQARRPGVPAGGVRTPPWNRISGHQPRLLHWGSQRAQGGPRLGLGGGRDGEVAAQSGTRCHRLAARDRPFRQCPGSCPALRRHVSDLEPAHLAAVERLAHLLRDAQRGVLGK